MHLVVDEDHVVAWSEEGWDDGPRDVVASLSSLGLDWRGPRNSAEWSQTFDDFVWVEPDDQEDARGCSHPAAQALGGGCYVCPDCHTIYCTVDPGPPPPTSLHAILEIVDPRARAVTRWCDPGAGR